MTNAGQDDRESLVGADVERTWRALSREEPTASLDASILAAAHREARAGPQSVGAKEAKAARRRWWPLAAAATVAAIAVGVLQLTPPEDVGAPSPHATVSDVPAPPAKKTEAAAAAPVSRAEAPPEPARQAPKVRPAPPASPAPEPFPATPRRADAGANVAAEAQVAPMARKEVPAPPAATGSVAAERGSQAPAPAAAVAAAPPTMAEPAPRASAPLAKMAATRAEDAAGAARVKDRAPLPIPDWIALIRRLRDEGKTAEAAKELAAFRTAHADHEKLLPPDLRDWHPPEK